MTRLPEEFIRVVFIDDSGVAVEVSNPFDIFFTIDKVSSRRPDSAECVVLNLKESIRKKISAESTTIEIYAGPTYPPPLLYSGPITDVEVPRSEDFVDWVTKVSSEDTKRNLRERIVSRSFSAGTKLTTVILDLAAAAETTADVSQVSGVIPVPLPLLGSPSKLLHEVCELYSYRYQILAGVIVVLPEDAPLSGPDIPVVNKLTGLRGVPTSSLENRVVKVTAVTRLDASLQPGGLAIIETESTTGSRKAPIKRSATYFLERVTFQKDKGPFTATLVGREYG